MYAGVTLGGLKTGHNDTKGVLCTHTLDFGRKLEYFRQKTWYTRPARLLYFICLGSRAFSERASADEGEKRRQALP